LLGWPVEAAGRSMLSRPCELPVRLPMMVPALMRIGVAEASVDVPYQTNWFKDPWNAYTTIFAAAGTSLKPGVDYDASWKLQPGQFPSRSETDWYVPKGTIPNSLGVWGASSLAEDNYDSSPLTGAPVMICDLLEYTSEIDFSFEGSINWDMLSETWLTRQARTGPKGNSTFWGVAGNLTSGSKTISNIDTGVIANIAPGMLISGTGIQAGSTITAVSANGITISLNATATTTGAAFNIQINLKEVGFLFYDPTYDFHNGGALIGNYTDRGVEWSARSNGGFITVAPVAGGKTQGVTDRRLMLLYLAKMGVLTGSEWVNGWSTMQEFKGEAGTGSHGGNIKIGKLTRSKSVRSGIANADYLGLNLFSAGDAMTDWSTARVDFVTGEPDMEGGTSAVFMREQTGSADTHEAYKLALTVPSRASDIVWFEDFIPNRGRDEVYFYVAAESFAQQTSRRFNLATTEMAAGPDMLGTKLTGVSSQIIDLGNGGRRAFFTFNKAAGITSLFVSIALGNGSGKSYVGDTSKGISLRPRHRIHNIPRITITGSPGAASTGAAYSYQPVIAGGQDTIVWSFIGSLPTGWSINASTGEISGTASVAGTVAGRVRATGGDGFFGEQSVSISVTTAVAPANTALPAVTNPSVQSAYVVQGQTLTCSTGTWTGTAPTFTYQWRRGGTNISGATSSSYTVQAADDGAAIDCRVTATNSGGSATATATGTPTAIAGTVRLNEPFNSQNTWSSTGGVSYVSGKQRWTNSTRWNSARKDLSGTSGKTMRIIWDLDVVDSSDAFQLFLDGTTDPAGTTRSADGTYIENITIPAGLTQLAVGSDAENCSGDIDNILAIELP
jgi:hypothetical protein